MHSVAKCCRISLGALDIQDSLTARYITYGDPIVRMQTFFLCSVEAGKLGRCSRIEGQKERLYWVQ